MMIDDPLLQAVAAAVAGKAVDVLSESGAALLRRLRGRAAADPASAAVLRQADPDPQAVAAVRAVLRAVAASEPGLARGMTVLARQLPVPRQLPPATNAWVNRDDQLETLRRAAAEAPRRRVVAVLSGPAGVGKTALAVQAAQAVRWAVDGALYVDLRAGAAGGPLPPPAALRRLLRSLGVPDERIPSDADDLVTLWRSVTAQRQLTVLLDNADSAEQVDPLLPAAATCVVYVTSRSPLPALLAEGGQLIPVGPLDQDASALLLARICGPHRLAAEPAAVADMVKACAGMPLSLAVTAAHLVTHPDHSVAAAAGVLTTSPAALAHSGGSALMTAIDAAYAGLPAPAQRLFRLMLAHPGPDFTAGAAAAALAVPQDATAPALTTLVHAQLLHQPAPGRYSYPDQVRTYGRDLPGDPVEQEETLRRIVWWYLAAARAADRALTPYQRYAGDFEHHVAGLPPAAFDSDQAALAWLETERANLVEAVAATAPRWPDLAYAVSYALWPLFHLRRHHDDRQAVDGLAVDCAQRLDNPIYLAAALNRQGWGCYDRGEHAAAHDLFTRSQQIATDADDRYEQAAALAGRGVAALALHRNGEAIADLTQALASYRQLGIPRRIALTLVSLGRAHAAEDFPRTAIDLLGQAIDLLTALDTPDPLNLARARIILGGTLTTAGEHDLAATELGAALTATQQAGLTRGQAQAHNGLGELALAQHRYAGAVVHLRRAQALFVELGDTEAADVRRLLASIPAGAADRQDPA
jgi:tetratricopeptide (TPR) repeat protein